jgi:aconitate hydratase
VVEGTDPFGARSVVETEAGTFASYRLGRLEELGLGDPARLPYSIRVMLEALLRNAGGPFVSREDVEAMARWSPEGLPDMDTPFAPTRVVMQDFTGVPAVVDLAAMRSAMDRLDGDPGLINPVIPVDLVIDHSVQVDSYGATDSRALNEDLEFRRNQERYTVLRWATGAFENFRVVPPGKGIVHQVNLEYLASVVHFEGEGTPLAYPDTLVGTDSHTTMINGLGVMGWGVGGIEAEAVMLGQPYYMPIPQVVGFRMTGTLREGVTATDLVLTVTRMLRDHGVVGKFVEFHGPGMAALSLPDRATIANMAPEYGATMGFFPVDERTLDYMVLTGRPREHVNMVRAYLADQGLLFSPDATEPEYSSLLELDLAQVQPMLAGPKRPQDSIQLEQMGDLFHDLMGTDHPWCVARKEARGTDHSTWDDEGGDQSVGQPATGHTITDLAQDGVDHGSVVIAAITSCTNTSNPTVLIGAGLLAKKAVQAGLRTRPWVKTSLAPGSRVVTDYLEAAGLTPYLEELGFHLVAYGCTTCIGNSGPLPHDIATEIVDRDLTVASVLSGNRNFEGRIHPLVRANYLASPPLVVAFALAGTVDIDMVTQPLGMGTDGRPIFLRDIWPTSEEIGQLVSSSVLRSMFADQYSDVLAGTQLWNDLDVSGGDLYDWDDDSTYIREPPFFVDLPAQVGEVHDIIGARALALLGDSITTDHISPAGSFPEDGPAGQYLVGRGVAPGDFNSFGSRRGNHEVMMRGTFANIRLRNQLAPDTEGGWTIHVPSGEQMSIFDAAMRYVDEGAPLVVIGGREYGSGSSRDWAAKGTHLLGVHAVIAQSYERIHRSNLVGMGVLPLEFKDGDGAVALGLTGKETFDIMGMEDLTPGGDLTVMASDAVGSVQEFKVTVKLNSEVEVAYWRNGGILHKFIRDQMRVQD